MKEKCVLAAVGVDAPKEIISSLQNKGFSTITIPRHPCLPSGVASHPDMLFFVLDNKVFASSSYISACPEIKNALTSFGYKLVLCKTELYEKYPNDVCFNIAKVGNIIFGKSDSFAEEIVNAAPKNGVKTVHTKQGYAKCSTLILGSKAIITADSTIATSAASNGIEVLKITNSPDAISIEGYDYGFIGGCCGTFESIVYFSGNVFLHPDGERICEFCQSHGYTVENLGAKKLCDIGGIFFFPNLNQ